MKKKMKAISSMIGTGVVLGVGANVIGSVGGDASGIAKLSSFQPIIGNVIGVRWTMKELGKIGKATKKKK